MKEGIENNPDVWNGLFVHDDERRLVRGFVESISYVPRVDRVVTMAMMDQKGNQRQVLFVIVVGDKEGNPTPSELGDIHSIYSHICPNDEDEQLLLTYPTTEEGFAMFKSQLKYRYRLSVTLWQRPKEINSLSDCPLNFNSCLN